MKIANKRFRYLLCALFLLLAGCAGSLTNSDAPGCDLEKYPDPIRSDYILPYAAGDQYRIVRGNCSRQGHYLGDYGNLSFAYDFAMPIGTEVLAIRGGKVVSLVEKYRNGDRDWYHANFIAIQHADGTFAQYVHIAYNSVPLIVGQTVNQGDLIALSGDTGVTSASKLHLEVIDSPIERCVVNKATADCHTIPITFRNASPQEGPLIERRVYQALSFE